MKPTGKRKIYPHTPRIEKTDFICMFSTTHSPTHRGKGEKKNPSKFLINLHGDDHKNTFCLPSQLHVALNLSMAQNSMCSVCPSRALTSYLILSPTPTHNQQFNQDLPILLIHKNALSQLLQLDFQFHRYFFLSQNKEIKKENWQRLNNWFNSMCMYLVISKYNIKSY